MLKLKAFCVFDDKAKAFLPAFFMPTTAQAVRTFADCCNDGGHAFGRHPADYTLFHVGEFDTDSGCLIPLPMIEALRNGLLCVERDSDERQLTLVAKEG